jgi:hypothetical protein
MSVNLQKGVVPSVLKKLNHLFQFFHKSPQSFCADPNSELSTSLSSHFKAAIKSFCKGFQLRSYCCCIVLLSSLLIALFIRISPIQVVCPSSLSNRWTSGMERLRRSFELRSKYVNPGTRISNRENSPSTSQDMIPYSTGIS